MEKRFNRDEIETIMLQTVMARPHSIVHEYKIYHVANKVEEEVIKNIKGYKEATSLKELEDAVNDKDVKGVFIPEYASITSQGIKSVLNRTSLLKNIYCAFELQ
jgi:hypothetical protein